MVREFSEALKEVQESDKYKQFAEHHTDYYLAHGFTQLDKNGEHAKSWSIGFYSPDKDNIVSFTTSPLTKLPAEEAFKKDGTIDKLEEEGVITTEKAFEVLEKTIHGEYPQEVVNNYIFILQVIDKKATFNVTAVTLQFNMITVRIDALTGEVIAHKKRSILDLKKEDE